MKRKIHLAQLIIVVFSIIMMDAPSFGKDTLPAGQSKQNNSSSIPIGQSKVKAVIPGEGVSADIFGRQSGRVHPFLLFQELYSDNLFATNSHAENDFVTTIAPGLWLAFPGNRAKLLSIDTSTTSPGGLKLSRIKPETVRRYQSYFLYSPEFTFYGKNTRLNHVNQKANALLQYNFNSGLSFDLMNLFHDREEIAGNGIANTLYRYQDNLADLITRYEAPSGKFKLQFEYSNYNLDYKDRGVQYRNRNDNSFRTSVFFKVRPKTFIIAEYDFININFDAGSRDDSVENRYYCGVTWDVTAKTRGTLKLGYAEKNFDLSSVKDQSGFSLELQAQHNFTPKRGLVVNAYRKFNESDLATASSFLSTGIEMALLQRFTAKWSGTLDALYQRNEYYGVNRDDDLIGFGPAIRFEAKKWLIFDLGYHYYYNNSNTDFYDYHVNQFFFRGTISM